MTKAVSTMLEYVEQLRFSINEIPKREDHAGRLEQIRHTQRLLGTLQIVLADTCVITKQESEDGR